LKFLLLFRFFASFHFQTLFRIKAKNISRFGSFRFEAKMTAVLLLFRLVFALFHFSFASDFYVSHQCEQAKKHFFRSEAKKISLPFRFISLRSENDGAP
jgi:hypothetical protein